MKKLQLFFGAMIAFGLSIHAKDNNVADMNDAMDNYEMVEGDDVFIDPSILKLEDANNIESAQQKVEDLLAQNNPEKIDEIAIDEAQLQASFDKILKFVRHVNNKIEKLAKSSKKLEENDIAVFAAELADAEMQLDKTEASYIVKHGVQKNNRDSQEVKKALQNALENLRPLQEKVVQSFDKMMKSKTAQKAKKTASQVRSKASRAIAAASSSKAAQKTKQFTQQMYTQAKPYLQEAKDFSIDAGNAIADASKDAFEYAQDRGEQALEYVQDWYEEQ